MSDIRESLQVIMLKAMDSAREGITISDATQPDNPLIYVNKGFTEMTGYSYEEVVGKNCRFLQGVDTDKSMVRLLHKGIQLHKIVQVEILNYSKTGKAFWNRLSVTPIFDEEGKLLHFIGVQEDVTVQRENQLAAQKTALHKLISETTIQAQERERDQMGKELHDNVNQLLATCRLYLNIATTDEAMRMDMIEQTSALINTAIEEIRKLSRTLVGPRLGEISLKDSLKDLVQSLQKAVPFTISLTCKHLKEVTICQSKQLMLFRIVQEQLNNIIKHAECKNVAINITNQNNSVFLSVKDDGNGFETARTTEGIGLKNMKSRVALENGSLALNTAPGLGCELLITLPL